MSLHAFKLRAEYEGLDPDTTISLPDGSDYQVGQAFKDAKDGLVVLDDEKPEDVDQINTLDAYFAVKSASVPEPARKSAAKNADTSKEG